jgi:hypothetical protein
VKEADHEHEEEDRKQPLPRHRDPSAAARRRWEEAARHAVETAGKTLRDLRVAGKCGQARPRDLNGKVTA